MFMKTKTSVYLDPDQVAELKRTAEATGRSEADLIREGVELALLHHRVVRRSRPRPTFDSGDPEFASRADELLNRVYE